VKPGPRRKLLGLDAAIVSDVTFDAVRVPESARLAAGGDVPAGLTRAFARLALLGAARAVGLASRAWELTREYTSDRKAFGKPIGHFQAVAFTVADRLMDVEGARWLVWKAAAGWEQDGAPRLVDVAAAGAHALEAALRCADDGVQLHGGAGFIRDYAVEKLFRDARQLALMGPSVAALDQLLADTALGRPLDPAAVLPTPDVQPVFI
jgi:acyl-CoA dehydrogenase